MCGIFAMFYSLTDSMNSIHFKNIEYQFNKAQSRGPEHSIITKIDNNTILGFHRLAINGLDDISNQPIYDSGIYLICNGEIYNYKSILKNLNVQPKTNSDCECIIHLYKKYGIEYTLQNLDGVFSFILYDTNTNQIYAAKDPFGVRPMYIGTDENTLIFSSLLKQITNLTNNVEDFPSGSYTKISRYSDNDNELILSGYISYTSFNYHHTINTSLTDYSYIYSAIYNLLIESVKKRVINSERNFACLLSGGLDSSLISAIVSKWIPSGQLQTYSIGMSGGSDLKYAKMVSNHINSKHTEIILTENEFFDAIPEVIYNIESYDTTTVRASVGNYLIAKYISNNSDAKVIFNGDGSDEVTGGYMYFHNCPNDIEFDYECKRLLSNIQYYDVLRSDRSVSCHGLECRTPFLDRSFVHHYLSIPMEYRNHNNGKRIEKYLLRKSIERMDPNLLPPQILWRPKEAFSDGVSSQENSWFKIIQQLLEYRYTDEEFQTQSNMYSINKPTTKEQLYYREIFESHYKNRENIIPNFWMPKYSDTNDASARTLNVYNTTESKINLTIDVKSRGNSL